MNTFTRQEKAGLILLDILGIVIVLVLAVIDPIPQDSNYHRFVDGSTYLSVPNALNVLSNLPFFVVGAMGLIGLKSNTIILKPGQSKMPYVALFAGSSLVAFGSGYYHLEPDNQSLLWDRLPMTIAFMGLFSIIISEFISEKLGRVLLLPLLGVGMFSVLYWYYSELSGSGDLRPYAFIQFFPMIAIPAILVMFKSSYTRVSGYWWLLLAYLAAKLFEYYDALMFDTFGFVSGHSIKHIVAAMGLFVLLKSYHRRIVIL